MAQSLGMYSCMQSAFLVYFSSLTITAAFPYVPNSFFFLHSSLNSSRSYLDLCEFSILAFSSLTFFCSLFHLFFCMTSAVSCTSFFKFLQFVPFKPYFLHSVLDLSNTVVLLKFLLPAFVSSWQLASHNFIPFCCLCCCYLYHISLLLFHQFILSYKTLESYALLLFHSHLIQSNSLLLPFFALYKS